MIFLIIWYLSGVITFLIAEYQDEGEVTLKMLLIALTLGGILGFIMVIVGGAKIINDASDTKEWKEFWNQKIF
jgi:hypothetical protein